MRRTLRRGVFAAGGTLLAAAASRKLFGHPAEAQPGAPKPPVQALDAIRQHPPTKLPPLVFTASDGRSRSLADYAGHGLLLNLWATWCVPCVGEMPALDALARTLSSSGIQVLTVSLDRGGIDEVRPFYAAHGIRTLPILLDPHSTLLAALKLDGIPTTLLVNRDGQEVARLQGPVDWSSPQAAALIRRLVG